jgi:cytochrome P450
MRSASASTAKHVIDFDHHASKLRDHNTEQLKELMYNPGGCPLGWSNAHEGFWAVWGYDALYDAVQDVETFSSTHLPPDHPKGVPGAMYADPLIPIDYDGQLQQDYRKVVLSWFNPGHAKSLKPRVEQICDELIDDFIERGEAELSYELFTALPAIVTLEMLDWDSSRWREWVHWVHAMIHDSIVDPEGSMAAINCLYSNIGMEIARRREQLGDDLFSDMMRTPMPDGRLLTDAELTNFAFLVLLGGMDTTSGTTGNSLLLIDRDPELRQQMIDNVDNMPKVIEEFLRIAGPGGGLYRRLTKDVEFHGEQMHEGDKVLMMYWAANRDPKAFPDPETIDIFRTNNRHMAFGLGPHRCLGSHHARLMLATLFRGVFTRIPDFEVQWDGVERFEDCGSVYAVRHLPVTFTPGARVRARES